MLAYVQRTTVKLPDDLDARLRHEADGQGYLEPGYHHLFVLPADGGSARQVTSGSYQHRGAPAWTPDGRRLVFSANRNPDWEHDFPAGVRDHYRIRFELKPEDGEGFPGAARTELVLPDELPALLAEIQTDARSRYGARFDQPLDQP